MNLPPIKGLSDSIAWFREHSHEYGGLWVAVQQGKLLGTASQRKTLVDELGDAANEPDVFITWIP